MCYATCIEQDVARRVDVQPVDIRRPLLTPSLPAAPAAGSNDGSSSLSTASPHSLSDYRKVAPNTGDQGSNDDIYMPTGLTRRPLGQHDNEGDAVPLAELGSQFSDSQSVDSSPERQHDVDDQSVDSTCNAMSQRLVAVTAL